MAKAAAAPQTCTGWSASTLASPTRFRSLTAHALLAALAGATRTHQSSPAGLIPPTCNEVTRLVNRSIANPRRSLTTVLRWSTEPLPT
jgi:hypothetical protein